MFQIILNLLYPDAQRTPNSQRHSSIGAAERANSYLLEEGVVVLFPRGDFSATLTQLASRQFPQCFVAIADDLLSVVTRTLIVVDQLVIAPLVTRVEILDQSDQTPSSHADRAARSSKHRRLTWPWPIQ